jgi:hypothetical protein
MCVDLNDTVCGTVYGLLSNPRSIVVGALVPGTFGANQAQGKAIEHAIRSAVDGFNTGLDPQARPLAVVVCDESATGAVSILLDDLAVSAIFAEPVESLITPAQQHNTAIVSPFYRPDVSFDLAFSLAPPTEREAIAISELISSDLLPLLENAGISAAKITLVADPGSPFHAALRTEVSPRLTAMSGISVESIDATVQTSTTSIGQAVIASAPDVIVVMGDQRLTDVIATIEGGWPVTRRPLYVLSDRLETPRLYDTGLPALSADDPSLRKRTLGISIGGSLTRSVAQDFLNRVEPDDPRTSGANGAYDAMYLVGYAAAAQHTLSTITGDDLVTGLGRLSGGTVGVDVGPSGRATALPQLLSASGASVSIEGVTAKLAFTNRTIASDLQVWCVSKSTTKTAFAESGKALAAGATTLSGALSAGCQPAL